MRIALLAAVFSLGVVSLGCGDDEPPGFVPPAILPDVNASYAAMVRANYEDVLVKLDELAVALDAFVAAPSADTLEAARAAWLAAREPYLQTEVYRFYDGPIDNAADGPEKRVNAWPMDEALVDYVVDAPSAGVINDPAGFPTIDAASVEALNESGGETNIATGFHPIEFLLWGQDLSATGPGERPFTDYVVGGTHENQERRGQYLRVLGELLQVHMRQVADAWAADVPGNYRAGFELSNPLESFEKILTGLIVLTGFETGGERIQAALESGDQEDEHSCFSDNTHRDMIVDVTGMVNVYEGRYLRLDGTMVSGPSVYDAVRAVDPALADRVRAELEVTRMRAAALVPPFDREIAPDNPEGNERVRAFGTALRTQEATLLEVFEAFGLTAEIPGA
jgi:putative iron-regulated protein